MEETSFVTKQPSHIDNDEWREYSESLGGVYYPVLGGWVIPSGARSQLQDWIIHYPKKTNKKTEGKTSKKGSGKKDFDTGQSKKERVKTVKKDEEEEKQERKQSKKSKQSIKKKPANGADRMYDMYPKEIQKWSTDRQIHEMSSLLDNDINLLESVLGAHTVSGILKGNSFTDVDDMNIWEIRTAIEAIIKEVSFNWPNDKKEQCRKAVQKAFLKKHFDKLYEITKMLEATHKNNLQAILLGTMGSLWGRERNLLKLSKKEMIKLVQNSLEDGSMCIADCEQVMREHIR